MWKAQMRKEFPIPATDAVCRQPPRRRGGFTLTESLIAAAVLAASVIGVAAALSASYQHAATLESTATATTLARQLLEQVVAMPFEDDDPTSEYRSIADYHQRPYTDTTTALTSRNGTALNVGHGQSYLRQVTVHYRLTPEGKNVATSDLAVVTVTVTPPPPHPAVSLSRLVTAGQVEY